jgi:hypothetical protein
MPDFQLLKSGAMEQNEAENSGPAMMHLFCCCGAIGAGPGGCFTRATPIVVLVCFSSGGMGAGKIFWGIKIIGEGSILVLLLLHVWVHPLGFASALLDIAAAGCSGCGAPTAAPCAVGASVMALLPLCF